MIFNPLNQIQILNHENQSVQSVCAKKMYLNVIWNSICNIYARDNIIMYLKKVHVISVCIQKK